MSDVAAQARYEQFAELHRGPDTFIMPNAWDGPSALLFKEAGFKSIATSSAAFAATLGRIDGIHAVSRDEHLDYAALLTSVSGLPINGQRLSRRRWAGSTASMPLAVTSTWTMPPYSRP